MKKLLFILTIFFIGFQNISAQENVENNDTIKKNFRIEKTATFKGGDKKLMNFIESQLVYPKEASKMGVQQKLFIKFVVFKDGIVGDIEVEKTIKIDKLSNSEKYQKMVELLKEEAIRVIKATEGKWKVGTDKGEPADSHFILPVCFVIQ